MHCEIKLLDDSIFQSTEGTDPIVLSFNDIPPGWGEGMLLMSIGSKYKFYIPSSLAYGEEGLRDWYGRETLPPFATLIVEAELLEINPAMGE